jgi:hypothetical protein
MSYRASLAQLLTVNKCKVVNISMGLAGVVGAASFENGNERAMRYVERFDSDIEDFLQRILDMGIEFVICKAGGNENNTKYVRDENAVYGYTDLDTYLSVNKIKEKDIDENDIYSGNVKAAYSGFGTIKNTEVRNRIIIVGAIDESYTVLKMSNCGGEVDVLAPGADIYSTVYKDGKDYKTDYGDMSGTSMASPHVAAVAAMVWGVNPDLKGDQVKEIIGGSAVKDKCAPAFSYDVKKPLLDAKAAVLMAMRLPVIEVELKKDSPYKIDIDGDKTDDTVTVKRGAEADALVINSSRFGECVFPFDYSYMPDHAALLAIDTGNRRYSICAYTFTGGIGAVSFDGIVLYGTESGWEKTTSLNSLNYVYENAGKNVKTDRRIGGVSYVLNDETEGLDFVFSQHLYSGSAVNTVGYGYTQVSFDLVSKNLITVKQWTDMYY